MRPLLSVIIILISLNCHAQIYMKVDSNNHITYTDTPTQDAKAIDLPGIKDASAQTPVTAESTDAAETEKTDKPLVAGGKVNYSQFRIISPVDQETIQNQPTLKVTLKSEPELQEGDKIQIFVDGKRMGPPTASTTIDAGRVDRGTHELYGLIVDKTNKMIMQSNVITIYIQQAHTGAPNAPPPPKKVSALISTLKGFFVSSR